MSLSSLTGKVLGGEALTREESLSLVDAEGAEAFELFASASRVRERFRPPAVDLCSIVSAKTGLCSEDCSYCAQSKISRARVETHGLVGLDHVAERARAARAWGARRFCIVTSGRAPSKEELGRIARMVSAVRREGLLPCATLGLLGEGELRTLREAGLHRFHHNLETSRRFFPEVCRSHGYDDKLRTIGAVKKVGLSLCSGGIFGLGEEWEDRVDMALALRDIGADSVPINFLVPVEGTPLAGAEPLAPLEALRVISLYRMLLPDREIRVAGGRLQTLGELNSFVIMAGADGLLTGDCLTVSGRSAEDDLRMIRGYGLEAATD
jgi:biotin synthase